jgi:uncharacterized protein (TIGR00288 family)
MANTSQPVDSAASPSADRHIALLIDADNVSHTKIAAILTEITRYGTANIRRAYGDWSAGTLKGWKEKLHEYAVRPIQQFSYSSGKNATDIALVIDALELLYTQRLDAFCIASSDGDFTPLVMHLRAAGKAVYGFGKANTPAAFVNACTTFLFLERLGDAEEAAPAELVPAKPAPPAAKAATPVKVLAQDVKLVETLRGAVEASAGDDGWARLSAAGSAAKRLASIDPRNHGVSNFTKLFEATGLFEIVRDQSGQPYLADRRNKDRAPKPSG